MACQSPLFLIHGVGLIALARFTLPWEGQARPGWESMHGEQGSVDKGRHFCGLSQIRDACGYRFNESDAFGYRFNENGTTHDRTHFRSVMTRGSRLE